MPKEVCIPPTEEISIMVAKRVVNLGQEVFVLSPNGEVVRTVVAKLEENSYSFLNGDDERRPHWFSFEDAVSAASSRINAQQTVLRKELRALARRRRTLETQDYQDGVMNASYTVVDLDNRTAFTRSRRVRKLKKIRVPETYLVPGHMVYVVITPASRPELGFDVYRPYKHFVLETEVMNVCFSPDGQVHYAFSTRFIVKEFFLSRKEATARLESYSEPGTKDSVHFVSSAQEKKELDEEDDIPF